MKRISKLTSLVWLAAIMTVASASGVAAAAPAMIAEALVAAQASGGANDATAIKAAEAAVLLPKRADAVGASNAAAL